VAWSILKHQFHAWIADRLFSTTWLNGQSKLGDSRPQQHRLIRLWLREFERLTSPSQNSGKNYLLFAKGSTEAKFIPSSLIHKANWIDCRETNQGPLA
jgi:hypothetical protein